MSRVCTLPLPAVCAPYRQLNEIDGGYALRAELAELTGRTSVPALYIGGEFVGGCNDGGLGGVMTLERDGRLKPMLAAAGAV